MIIKGFLCEVRMDPVPGLTFPVMHLNGKPATGDYRGDAWVANGEMRIVSGTYCEDFKIMPATQSSIDYRDGWVFASNQKRKYTPRNKSSDFIAGWYDNWRDRCPLKLSNEKS